MSLKEYYETEDWNDEQEMKKMNERIGDLNGDMNLTVSVSGGIASVNYKELAEFIDTAIQTKKDKNELETLVFRFGDGVTDMFGKLMDEEWVDAKGYTLAMKKEMLRLATVVNDAVEVLSEQGAVYNLDKDDE